MDKIAWERAVIYNIIVRCEVSNGDAQGIVEAQEELKSFCFNRGYSAAKTAQLIDIASIVE